MHQEVLQHPQIPQEQIDTEFNRIVTEEKLAYGGMEDYMDAMYAMQQVETLSADQPSELKDQHQAKVLDFVVAQNKVTSHSADVRSEIAAWQDEARQQLLFRQHRDTMLRFLEEDDEEKKTVGAR